MSQIKTPSLVQQKYLRIIYSMFQLKQGQETALSLKDGRHSFIFRRKTTDTNLNVYYLDRLEPLMAILSAHQGQWVPYYVNKTKFPQFSPAFTQFQRLLQQLNFDWTVLTKSRYRYKCTKCRRSLRSQYWRSCGHGKSCGVEITKSNYQRFKERKIEREAKERDQIIKKEEECQIKQEECLLNQT